MKSNIKSSSTSAADLNRLLYSVQEVSQILSIGSTKIYELTNSGKLDKTKVGRATRITRFSLVRYLIEIGAWNDPEGEGDG